MTCAHLSLLLFYTKTSNRLFSYNDSFSHNDVCSPVTVIRPAKVRTVDASEFQESTREVGEGISRHFNKLRTPIDRQGVPECRKARGCAGESPGIDKHACSDRSTKCGVSERANLRTPNQRRCAIEIQAKRACHACVDRYLDQRSCLVDRQHMSAKDDSKFNLRSGLGGGQQLTGLQC
jgi:hypothetical protein